MTGQYPDAEDCVVLIVDDEPDMRYLLASVLQTAGYEIIQAAHGEAALGQVRASRPRLVITDRMMPVMGGDELIERLRADQATAGIAIVLLTGTPGKQPGADAVIMKPFEHDELIGVVNRLTGKGTGGAHQHRHR